MKIRHLAIVPALFLMTACGGSTPEAETPGGEAAAAPEAKPADDAKPAADKPAEGAAAPADKPADAPAAEEKK